MKNIWNEREKALENQYIHKQEMEKLERLRKAARDEIFREFCQNRCPKCGGTLEAMVFQGVPLDKCPGCGGVWLGPNDLKILARTEHPTWFEKWFGGGE